MQQKSSVHFGISARVYIQNSNFLFFPTYCLLAWSNGLYGMRISHRCLPAIAGIKVIAHSNNNISRGFNRAVYANSACWYKPMTLVALYTYTVSYQS